MYQSMMTFIYVSDIKVAVDFMEKALKLEAVYEPSWAKVYKVSNKGFLGLVDQNKGSVKTKYQGGTLISLTVDSIDDYYDSIKAYGVESLSEIKVFEDIGVRSFFFKGPGGYDFEIQMFTNEAIKKLF